MGCDRWLVSSVFGLAALFATGAASADVLITVDKTTQRMSVAVDGQDRYSWPVSTGVADYDTPSGSYTPFRMERDHFSKEWDDAPMPHSIFFTRVGHAIHGTSHMRQLGRPASHGCVRLAPAQAATLFALVKAEGMKNTRVVIEGDESAAADVAPARRGAARHGRSQRAGDDGATSGIHTLRNSLESDPVEPAFDGDGFSTE